MWPLTDLFNLERTEHRSLFDAIENPWDVLVAIAAYLRANLPGPTRGALVDAKATVGDRVFIGPGTRVEAGAHIQGPAWIGANCTLRSGCYVRDNVIAGDGCMLGNSSEFKNCILFDEVQAPHFNYVGDSVLGHGAHLGAGVILSNVRLDKRPVSISSAEGPIQTGLRKFGALVGDHAEIGCNAVLSPGSIIGRESIIYPGTQWRGVLPARSVAKLIQEIQITPRRG